MASPSIAKLKAYVKRMRNKIAIARKYDNEVTCELYKKQLDRIELLKDQVENVREDVAGTFQCMLDTVTLLTTVVRPAESGVAGAPAARVRDGPRRVDRGNRRVGRGR